MLNSLGCSQLINEPTHILKNSKSLTDILFYNKEIINEFSITDSTFSDDKCIGNKWKCEKTRFVPIVIT